MSAAWSAGCVRARSMLSRRVGAGGARELASRASLEEVLQQLAAGPYQRGIRPGQSLEDAQRAVAATVLWHLRVLAGWLPREGAESVRALAGWFEVANVVEQVQQPGTPPYLLGSLAVSWPRLARAASPEQMREELAASPWGDPGGSDPRTIAVGVQFAWAVRVAERVPRAQDWAAGGAALLFARERFLAEQPLAEPAVRRAAVLLGADAVGSASFADLRARLRGDARWVLSDVDGPGELWRAEVRWWDRVARDALKLLRTTGFGPDVVVGCAVLLGVDARKVRAALEISARGGRPLEAFDVLA
ncbi:hypothetical protein OU415_06805 [Saccharopolyspora sp. WRP15-2]|uniref:V-type ATPase subunit n=1 Tax=Saccharopolyspora oryzae TaxID=2997343 RepID=A0ABT4UTT3_9PSEU|nr:hypothetical protein [Saccharopolyspora oryzae]MDA3625137.1 hypothetical protein [Saccharopolyspora oryzae]